MTKEIKKKEEHKKKNKKRGKQDRELLGAYNLLRKKSGLWTVPYWQLRSSANNHSNACVFLFQKSQQFTLLSFMLLVNPRNCKKI
jgi:hypothetical protein